MTTKQNQPQEATTSPLVRPKHPYSQVLKWVADGEEIQGRDTNGEYRDIPTSGVLNAVQCGSPDSMYFQPSEFRIKPKPHIHQELMDAHKAGAIIQFQSHEGWLDCALNSPTWAVSVQYRIKPQHKPDIIGYCNVTNYSILKGSIDFGQCSDKLIPTDNIKVTFCGETLKLKAIEMIRGDSNGTI